MAKTTEELSELSINYLTEEQYEAAKTNGELSENEIYMTPEFGGSVPGGGTKNQVLTKRSAADGDYGWQTPDATGGSTGSSISKVTLWESSGMPISGGSGGKYTMSESINDFSFVVIYCTVYGQSGIMVPVFFSVDAEKTWYDSNFGSHLLTTVAGIGYNGYRRNFTFSEDGLTMTDSSGYDSSGTNEKAMLAYKVVGYK